MKVAFLNFVLLLVCKICCCQYYFNDIVSLKESNQMYLLLKNSQFKLVTAKSVESDNTTSRDFSYKREVTNNGNLLITHASLSSTGETTTLEYYSAGRLIKSIDSAALVTTTTNYTYNADGSVSLVKIESDDTSRNMHSTEIHQWFYSGNVIDSMLRIKDFRDTTVVHFAKDELQNPAEEIWLKNGHIIEHYFYYFDKMNRITDIVRFNSRAKQLLPDFLFEYNDNGQVSQLTQVPQGSSDYVIWEYIYDDNGLKSKDILFDKHQQLLGTITYTYQ